MEPNQLIIKFIKGTISSRTKHNSRRKEVDEKRPREKTTTTHALMGFMTCYEAVRIISQGTDNYNRQLRPETETLDLGWSQHCRLL